MGQEGKKACWVVGFLSSFIWPKNNGGVLGRRLGQWPQLGDEGLLEFYLVDYAQLF